MSQRASQLLLLVLLCVSSVSVVVNTRAQTGKRAVWCQNNDMDTPDFFRFETMALRRRLASPSKSRLTSISPAYLVLMCCVLVLVVVLVMLKIRCVFKRRRGLSLETRSEQRCRCHVSTVSCIFDCNLLEYFFGILHCEGCWQGCFRGCFRAAFTFGLLCRVVIER